MNVIFSALVPIYFVLLLGYTAGKCRVVNNAHVGELNTVVMTYALPASLFAATAATSRQAMLAQWPLLVILAAAMMLVYPVWYLLERRGFRRSASESALQVLTVSLPNFAAAGLPIVTALLGADHAVPVAVAIAAGSLLPSPVTLALLELSDPKAGNGKGGAAAKCFVAMGHALIKPIVLAPVIGTVISLVGWRMPALVTLSLRQIGQVAGGLALFVTGLILSAQRFRLNGNVILATVVVSFIQPLLALGAALVLGVSMAMLKMGVLMAALPSGFFGILFGANKGLTSENSGAIVIASTLVSMVTLAVVIAWLYG